VDAHNVHKSEWNVGSYRTTTSRSFRKKGSSREITEGNFFASTMQLDVVVIKTLSTIKADLIENKFL
jgi:hypothetical protein